MSDRSLASFLHELLLTPYLDGPIARIEAAVTRAGVPEHVKDDGDPGDTDDGAEKRERAWYAEYRREIGATGRSAVQYSDPAS